MGGLSVPEQKLESLVISTQRFLIVNQWTKKVLTILCKLGKRLGYTAWATGVPDEYRDGNEWLYDVMWCNSDISDTYDRLISVPMVAECEWGNLGKIIYKKLREHVRTFNGARGDTYLLIAHVGDVSETKWFEFTEIVDQGPGTHPYSKTL